MISEWIRVVEQRLNHNITCPLKAGLLEYKGGNASTKSMKEFSPMFVTSKDKNNEITFLIKITFMAKIGGRMESVFEYIDDGFLMSDL